ncbi:sensor histidine kinase [Paenibacillus monticola]|uniref:HAMP domain-containing protein n=1 Tax=Paenibacillus monticola TaxID=2666075 RepID=A0A7X2HAM7_9BACL|nr:sensor histidine kinase [Paenibacillus monticola]MRN56607.1 HAMP domain-containing protein [Paenibacillus monticola]
MRISTKMFLGYVLLIVLPFLFFSLFIYFQLYDKLLTQYQLANQQNIEQAAANLDSSLVKMESLTSIYQNNAALIDFLQGEVVDDRDLIYSYLKEINPAFSFAYLADPLVKNLIVYPKTQTRMLQAPGFQDYREIEQLLTPGEVNQLRPDRGLWKHSFDSAAPVLNYYHKLYSNSYTTDLGIVQISVQPVLLDNMVLALTQVHPDNAVMMLDRQGDVVYPVINTKLSTDQIRSITRTLGSETEGTFLADHDRLLINSVHISRLGLTVIEVNKRTALIEFLRVKQLWVAVGLGLLSLLSILYYWIISSVTKRIVRLSRHMRRVEPEFLNNPLKGKAGKDEIGFLITNYNEMISRMDELVNHVQKVEMLKNEADFKMLQAQIQPHFLYNTLETMRMLARSNKDYKVAEMAFSLGNLFRYSLSKSDHTTLRDELDHVNAYIAIHQIRMRDLEVEVQLDEAFLALPCPRFILQPLVENSMIHGLSGKRGAKWIALRFGREQGYARIEIADNGSGMSADQVISLQRMLDGSKPNHEPQRETTGIGLSNVTERVKAYFGNESSLTITSTPGEGTVCCLRLLLKEDYAYAEADDCG